MKITKPFPDDKDDIARRKDREKWNFIWDFTMVITVILITITLMYKMFHS